ncbi:hypothetical protein GCM10010282_32370 [Streptomyces roseolus]|nr:hypothetical protein GCM10010282_32370 [Streptomyces roseolus]
MQSVIKSPSVRHHARSDAFRIHGLSSHSAHAAFGGHKRSGIGRETHKMMPEHYQQTKKLLASDSPHRPLPSRFTDARRRDAGTRSSRAETGARASCRRQRARL